MWMKIKTKKINSTKMKSLKFLNSSDKKMFKKIIKIEKHTKSFYNDNNSFWFRKKPILLKRLKNNFSNKKVS